MGMGWLDTYSRSVVQCMLTATSPKCDTMYIYSKARTFLHSAFYIRQIISLTTRARDLSRLYFLILAFVLLRLNALKLLAFS